MSYRIIATARDSDASTPEYLGACWGSVYSSRDDAEREAAALRATVDDFGLDHETTYDVVEVA